MYIYENCLQEWPGKNSYAADRSIDFILGQHFQKHRITHAGGCLVSIAAPGKTTWEVLMGRNKRLIPARLGQKLKAVREHLELTSEQLIERLDCPLIALNPGNIDKYENGLGEPPLIVLLQYARLAKVSMNILIDDEIDLLF